MKANTARAVATSAIWLAVALGLFGAAPVGESQPGVYLLIGITLASGATLSTGIIWIAGRRRGREDRRRGFEVIQAPERVEESNGR
jgi:hypothetical protein